MRLKLVLLSIVFVLLAFGLVAVTVSQQTLELARQERERVQAIYTASKEKELRHYVQLGQAALWRLASSEGDTATLQRQALAVLSKMHFGNDGYFFVYDRHGNILQDPSQMGMQGIDFCEPDSPVGQNQARLLLAKAQSGGGIVRYDWQKPSSQSYSPKMSFVVPAGQWDWVIGAGLYLDDIEDELNRIDQQARQSIQATQQRIYAIAAVAIVLIGVAGLAVNLGSHRVSSEKLQRLAQRVVRSQEDERVRVARELHDGVVQVMVSSKYLLETAQVQLDQRRAHRHTPQQLLEQGLRRLNDALSEIRRVSHGLRPALLDDLGLAAALRLLVEQLQPQCGFELRLIERGSALALPTSHSTALFRVVQEALNNIRAHAGASRVEITLAFTERQVRLSILDDGRGFDLKKVQADARGGIGLRNMRERIECLDGAFTMSSGSDCTLIEALLPVPLALAG